LGQIEQNPAKPGQSQSKEKRGIMAQTPQAGEPGGSHMKNATPPE
jgi:hypothetical protein